MNPTDLLKQSQTAHTTESLGVTEEVTYVHGSGTVYPDPLRCFVSNHEYNDKIKNTRRIENVFSSVLLTEEPKLDDEVTYEGEVYKVKRWESQLGRWVLYAERKKRHTGKRYKQR